MPDGGLGFKRGFGDDFDLYKRVLGKAGDGDGGTGGWDGAFGGEVFGVDLIHGGEVAHGFEEDGGFDDVGQVEACLREDGLYVFEDADGLLGDAARDQLAGGGVEGYLA